MVDRDVVAAKISALDHALSRIEEARDPDRRLIPIDAEDIVILNLQRATQSVIDLAAHVVTTEGYGLPDRVAESFRLLEKEGVIESELAESLRKMVGFRNLVVHRYEEIDPVIVESIVASRLGNLREFGRRILAYFGLE